MNCLAIIPARFEKDEIQQRCLNPFCEKPVIYYSIRAALESNLFDEVMVSTDSTDISSTAQKYGAKVPFLRNTGKDYYKEGITDVLEDVINSYLERGFYFDLICCIYPIAPFITKQLLISNYNILKSSGSDAIIPLIKYNYPPQRCFSITDEGYVQYKWPAFINKNRKELDPIFRDASQFFFIKTEAFLKEKKLVPLKTIPFYLNTMEHQDLFDEFGWLIAEYKYKFLRDIKLRNACIQDADKVFVWRNDKETRQNSFNHSILVYDNHIKWFSSALRREDIKLFMLTVGGISVGQARIDYINGEYEISYLIGNEFRGRGYGKTIIRMMENKIVELYGNVTIFAEVLKSNVVSRKIFLSLEFDEEEESDKFIYRKKAIYHGEYGIE